MKAFAVLHPQTCGGRLVTMALVEAGCFGDPEPGWRYTQENHPRQGHVQRLDLLLAKRYKLGKKTLVIDNKLLVDTWAYEQVRGVESMTQAFYDKWSQESITSIPRNVPLAWRRSVPHGSSWYVWDIVQKLEALGREVRVVVPWRVPCTTPKFVKERGTWEERAKALREIVKACQVAGYDPFFVSYDAFVLSPDYRRFVLLALGLTPPRVERTIYTHAGIEWEDKAWERMYQLMMPTSPESPKDPKGIDLGTPTDAATDIRSFARTVARARRVSGGGFDVKRRDL